MRNQRTTDELAAALRAAMDELILSSDDYSLVSSRFRTCTGRQASRMRERTPSQGHCKLVFCDPCQDLRWSGERDILRARVDRVLEKPGQRWVLSVTLSSPPVEIARAHRLTDQRLSGWARFSEWKAFRSIAYGHARSIRLRVDADAGEVRCNTNVFVIADRDTALQTADEWLLAWRRLPGCDGDQVDYFINIDVSSKEDRASHDRELSREVARVSRIGLEPAELCEVRDARPACDPEKLDLLYRALRGRKLIRSGLALAPSGT